MKHERRYVPLAELIEPKDGYVLVNRWWVTHPDKGAAFAVFPGGSKTGSPQCNRDSQIACSLAESIGEEGEQVQFIPVAFLGHTDWH